MQIPANDHPGPAKGSGNFSRTETKVKRLQGFSRMACKRIALERNNCEGE
jgi:hypothetical protein